MAPEMLQGNGRYTEQIDIFGLGVLLFNLVTGKMPFNRDCITQSTLHDRPAYTSLAWKSCSEELRELTEGLLEKEAGSRMTMDEVLDHPWIKKEMEINSEQNDPATSNFNKIEGRRILC